VSWAIGIDFGTSRSAGALCEVGGGRLDVTPLEIEGNRWIASMVLRTPDGELVIGTAADNLAGVHPDRLERTPKRALGTGAPLLLGGEPLDPRDAATAVLRAIIAEGRLRSGGAPPARAVLTHPVRWGEVRRTALREAGAAAGLDDIELVDEPVAAAIHYAADHVAVGAHVGIYDLGGGTFDTAVLQRTAGGFEVIGVPGGDERIGGEDFDHRMFRYFGECLAETAPEVWDEMLTSDDRKWKRASLDLLVQARRAKEALSSYTSTQVFVPIADRDIVVNRSQLEAMIVDDIERTVDLMEETVVDAGLAIDDLASVFLVGGSSRLPLVGQLLGERFGARVVTRDEPKAVVALGAARLAAVRAGAAPAPRSEMPPPGRAHRHDLPTRPAAASLAPPLPPPQAADHAVPAARPPATQQVAVAWRLALGQPAGQLAADIDAVVFGSADGFVRSVDPRSGQLRWQSPHGAAVWAAPGLLADAVAIGGLDGRVSLLDRATAAVRWVLDTGAPISASPAAAGAVVVAANDGGRVLGLDRERGGVRWELPVGSAVRAGVVPVGDEVIVATTAGQVYCVDAATGTCRWGYQTSGAITTTPGVVGDRILVPAEDGIVHAVRLADGVAVYGIRCEGPCATSVATSRTEAAIVDRGGVVRVHRADTGRVAAELAVGAGQAAGLVLVPHVEPTTAVIETGGGLIAVDLAARATRWELPTGQDNRVAPVMSGGLVISATTFGQLYGVVP
jgi:actin-like ATPase involved in cell morphogenesis